MEKLPKQELRQFSQEQYLEDRRQIAQEAKEKRQGYFGRQKETSIKIERLKGQAEKQEGDIAGLIQEIKVIDEEIAERKKSKIAELFNYGRIRKLSQEKETKILTQEEFEKDFKVLSDLLEELQQEASDKTELEEAKKTIEKFYHGISEKWEEYQESKTFEASTDKTEKILREGLDTGEIMEQQIEQLNDRELFTLADLLKNKFKECKEKNNQEQMDILRGLYGNMAFCFGKREGKAYYEVAEIPDKDLKKNIENLPKHILQQIEKITKTGIPYPAGASMFWGSEGPREKTPITWDNLLFIRKTNLMPEVNADGRFVVPHSPRRPTLHWTFNSPVAPHAYGSWADSSYTIFAPGKEMIAENNPPLVLNNVNTCWYDQDLILPENSVVLCEKNLTKNTEIEPQKDLLSLPFRDLYSWLLSQRAIIEQMGYSFFGGGPWSDPRVDELTKNLKEEFGMRGGLSIEHEQDTALLKKYKEEQYAKITKNESLEPNNL